jgi:hypothetical protein
VPDAHRRAELAEEEHPVAGTAEAKESQS